MPFKIETLTAFVTIGPDGDEGIMAARKGDTWMPLICADTVRIKEMLPIAKAISKISGKPFMVIELSVRSDVTEETIKKYS
jgi:hypothetical protein